MSDTECRDASGVPYPEHDYESGDAEGTRLIECYRCGAESGE